VGLYRVAGDVKGGGYLHAGCCAFYVSMVASDTEVPLLYEVPLLLVEQGA
jgi:hypothetical protein